MRFKIDSVSSPNLASFREIESAIFAIILDDSEPKTESELVRSVFRGGNGNSDIYADKSWSRFVTKNGLFASQSEVSEIL